MVVKRSLSWTAENIHVVPPSQTINAFAFNDLVAFSHQKLILGNLCPRQSVQFFYQCIRIVREELLFDFDLYFSCFSVICLTHLKKKMPCSILINPASTLHTCKRDPDHLESCALVCEHFQLQIFYSSALHPKASWAERDWSCT